MTTYSYTGGTASDVPRKGNVDRNMPDGDIVGGYGDDVPRKGNVDRNSMPAMEAQTMGGRSPQGERG